MEEKNSEAVVLGSEEEELGNFFERLGRLVPKLRCSCNDVSPCSYHSLQDVSGISCEPNPPSQKESNHSDYMSSETCSYEHPTLHDSRVHATTCMAADFADSQVTSHVYNLIPVQSLPSNSIHPIVNTKYNHLSKTTRGNHSVKPCRVRNRTAPYTITKHDMKFVNHTKPTTRYAQSTKYEPEGRLELLTDVIEYIHNLQNLLENAQGRSLDIAADLNQGSNHPEEQEGLQTTHSGKACYLFSGQDAKVDAVKQAQDSKSVPPVDQAIKLLDRVVPTAGTSSFRLVESVTSVDRAIEILEYKTGAITLTA
ncbi:hypothetical protein FHG87_012935 [Trinorchestia longiramus]|nr:hypothetical protein FHG87_012935 [Trinorchestia longiramus]